MDQLTYRLEGGEGETSVRLLDMAGRTIRRVTIYRDPTDGGLHEGLMNTSEIAAGIYFLEVKTATERKLVKVVKR